MVQTETQTQTMPPVATKPKNPMTSTWRSDKSQWGFWHVLMDKLAMHPTNLNQPVPVFEKTDKVPHIPAWVMHRWIIIHAFIPLAIHQAYIFATGKNLNVIAAFLFYTFWFKAAAIHHLHWMRWTGHRFGFFDGDKYARDQVPDQDIAKVATSLISTASVRPIMFLMFTYKISQAPADMNWTWLPLEVSLYGIVLDFYFYWYHRIMHDTDSLWKHHRTHHMTKHPNPLLTLYADEPQELFDIVVIPALAWATLKLMGMPMEFYAWWICSQYVVFSELVGHSGLRIHLIAPNPLSWLLELFNCELVIEDHDLHHRTGWRKSHNYGKQTRLWDQIFGTFKGRIECVEENVDYENLVPMPLLFDPSEPVKQPAGAQTMTSNGGSEGRSDPSLLKDHHA
jgi:sterol desaturase/sphingolipid hydroxylase (fatty acid hydroxylase superfamily)